MLIEVTKKEKTQVEIPVPCFLRRQDERVYMALLDEKTFVKISRFDDFTNIVNSTPEGYADQIQEAWETYVSCTESEFFTAYHETVDSISLHPKLAV